MPFSVTSTRRCPPASPLLRRHTDALHALPQRHDHPVQITQNHLHHVSCGKVQVDDMQQRSLELWQRADTARYALKCLVHEAQRHDIAHAVASKDEHAKIRLSAGWNAMHAQLDDALKNRLAQFQKQAGAAAKDAGHNNSAAAAPAVIDVSDILDTLSVLGIWFPDLPSPSYARRPQAILQLYYKYLEGEDIRADIAAFDRLHRAQSGRDPATSNCVPHLAATASALAGMPGHLLDDLDAVARLFPAAPTVAPALEQTPFVAQSRELRQLVTLRRIQKQGKAWPLPVCAHEARVIAQRRAQEDEAQHLWRQRSMSHDATPTTTAATSLSDNYDDDDTDEKTMTVLTVTNQGNEGCAIVMTMQQDRSNDEEDETSSTQQPLIDNKEKENEEDDGPFSPRAADAAAPPTTTSRRSRSRGSDRSTGSNKHSHHHPQAHILAVAVRRVLLAAVQNEAPQRHRGGAARRASLTHRRCGRVVARPLRRRRAPGAMAQHPRDDDPTSQQQRESRSSSSAGCLVVAGGGAAAASPSSLLSAKMATAAAKQQQLNLHHHQRRRRSHRRLVVV